MIEISKRSLNKYIFVLMFLSVYLFSYYIRENFLGSIGDFNFIFIISLILYIAINIKNVDVRMVSYITFILIYIIFIDKLGNGDSIESIIRNVFMYIIPIYILTIRIKRNLIKEILSSTLNLINIFTIIIFLIGIIDLLIGYKIMNFLGDSLVTGLKSLIVQNTILNPYRYTSYMGHALFTKEIFLYFYLLNIIYFKKFKKSKLNITLVTLISLIGILLTGSKTGTLLIIICILFTNYKKNKIFNFIICLCILIISYLAGFFNTVTNRLNNETLTSGRYEAGKILDSLSIMKIKFFI